MTKMDIMRNLFSCRLQNCPYFNSLVNFGQSYTTFFNEDPKINFTFFGEIFVLNNKLVGGGVGFWRLVVEVVGGDWL